MSRKWGSKRIRTRMAAAMAKPKKARRKLIRKPPVTAIDRARKLTPELIAEARREARASLKHY